MSVLDKVAAAVTPPESEEARRDAREKALAVAGPNDWFGIVLQQHEQIEQAFERVRAATGSEDRIAAHQALALILNGHSLAEEVVLYPALAVAHEKAHATMSYTEHAAAKMNLGELETIPVMSQDYLDKLEHVRGAVAHHMYEEEKTRFYELHDKVAADEQQRLTTRFLEEFDRYGAGEPPAHGMRAGAMGRGAPSGRGRGTPGYQS